MVSFDTSTSFETFLVFGAFVVFCFLTSGSGAAMLEATLSLSLSEEEDADDTGFH